MGWGTYWIVCATLLCFQNTVLPYPQLAPDWAIEPLGVTSSVSNLNLSWGSQGASSPEQVYSDRERASGFLPLPTSLPTVQLHF